MNIQKQINYWKSSAEEDLNAAQSLSEKGHHRHSLFFAELAVQKMIKAHTIKVTKNIPPKTHDLLRLADISKIPISDTQRKFLAHPQEFCLEGRYPDYNTISPSGEEAEIVLKESEEILLWLKNLL